MDGCERLRLIGNARQSGVDLFAKLVTELCSLLLVPVACVAKILTRTLTDTNADGHFFGKSASRTSSHERADCGFASCSRGASSSARRCDSGTGTCSGGMLSHNSEISRSRSGIGRLEISSFVRVRDMPPF